MIDISSRRAADLHARRTATCSAKGDEVQPGFLSILDPDRREDHAAGGLNSTGRRTVLANWLTDRRTR